MAMHRLAKAKTHAAMTKSTADWLSARFEDLARFHFLGNTSDVYSKRSTRICDFNSKWVATPAQQTCAAQKPVY